MSSTPVELYSAKYYGYCAVGGALCCGLTHAAVTPLDVIKCNLQTNSSVFTGTIQGFRHIYSGSAVQLGFSPGIKGLFKGWTPTLVGYSMQGLFKYGCYEIFKHEFSKMAGKENSVKYQDLIYIGASASAELIADLALCPMEAVKVRTQTNPKYASGILDGIPKLISQQGVAGLYAGITPLWARQVPYTIIKFLAFERIAQKIYDTLETKFNYPKKQMKPSEQIAVVFTAGYLAGILCAFVSHPADTLVSKINSLQMSGGIGQKIKTIYFGTPEKKGIGFAGLWGGFGSRVLMVGTLTGFQWFIYGAFKASVGLPTPGESLKDKK